MKILAIDTSSEICSIAVLKDRDLITKRDLNNSLTHSQKLMPMLDEVLKSCKLKLNDFDLLSCCIGPGSFTGVRIGISTIKAFNDVTNIPIVGVNSLESLAYNTLNTNIYDNTDIICSLIDARNDNVYCGIFQKNNNELIQLEDLYAKNIDEVMDILKKYSSKSILFVGNGALAHKYKILQNLSKTTFVEKELNDQTASSIGQLAYNKYLKKETKDSSSLHPLYLRKSQAERNLDGEL